MEVVSSSSSRVILEVWGVRYLYVYVYLIIIWKLGGP